MKQKITSIQVRGLQILANTQFQMWLPEVYHLDRHHGRYTHTYIQIEKYIDLSIYLIP